MDALFGGPVAANDNYISCAKCETAISSPRHGQKYCSEKCQRAVATAKYVVKAEFECQQCLSMFRPKRTDRTKFCSRECAFQDFRDRSAAIRPVSFSIFKRRCDCCSEWFVVTVKASRLCSDACRSENDRLKSRDRSAANDNRDHSPRACAECGEEFITSYGDLRSVYCSDACGRRRVRRVARKKERARLRGAMVESVDPIKVFERDRWRCKICGMSTPRRLRGTYDDRAPELDHVMPLSLGGAHSYLNTQCACRRCNAEKSDEPPTQPSLFAYAV